MNEQAVTLTPITLTAEERASALEDASHVTPELIGELVPYEPDLAPAEETTRLNFDHVERYVRAVQIYRDQPIDCSTPSGLEAAKVIRFRLRKLRTASEELRLEGNRPYMVRIESNNVRKKKIEDLLLPIEQRYDDAIKAEEKAIRERKAEAEKKAAEEAKVVTEAIAAIRARGTVRAGSTAAQIAAAAIDLTSDILDGEFYKDRYGEAVVAKEQAIMQLEEAQKAAQASEEREKLLADQRDELARRDAADAERKAADDAKEAERQAHENIRRSIANIRGITAWAIKASASDIRDKQAELDTIKQADFHPFEREAMEAHAEVTDALPDLLAMAEQRALNEAERIDAQKAQEQIDYFADTTNRFRRKGASSAEIAQYVRLLSDPSVLVGIRIGARAGEARQEIQRQIESMTALQKEREGAEKQAEADRIERDRMAAEKAAATARQNRMTRALAEQCMTMHAALLAVRADLDYMHLSDETRAAVEAPLAAIAKAEEGGAP